MEEYNTTQVIIIDDDMLNNQICEMLIKSYYPTAKIQCFTNPQLGLEHIIANYSIPGSVKTVLFIDTNMSVLSGWDFLDRFKDFSDIIKQQFQIYMFSSSIAVKDKHRAQNEPLISGFIEKPLSATVLKNIFSSI